jgi:hypothetical protein
MRAGFAHAVISEARPIDRGFAQVKPCPVLLARFCNKKRKAPGQIGARGREMFQFPAKVCRFSRVLSLRINRA